MRIHPLHAGHGLQARRPLSRSSSVVSEQFFDDDLVQRARVQEARLRGEVESASSGTLQEQWESMPLTRALMETLEAMHAHCRRNFVLRMGDGVLLTRFGLRATDGTTLTGTDYQDETVRGAIHTWRPLNAVAFSRLPDVESTLRAVAGKVRAQAVPLRRQPRERHNTKTNNQTLQGPPTQPVHDAILAARAEHRAIRLTDAGPRIFAHALPHTLEPTPLVQALMRSLKALNEAYGQEHALHVFGGRGGLYLTAQGFRKARDEKARFRVPKFLRRKRRWRIESRPGQRVLGWHARNSSGIDGDPPDSGSIASIRADGRGRYLADLALEDKSPAQLDWQRHPDPEAALRAVEAVLAKAAGHVESNAAVVAFAPRQEHAKAIDEDLMPTQDRQTQVATSLVTMAREEATRLEGQVSSRRRAPSDFLAYLGGLEKQPITQSLMKSLAAVGNSHGYPVGLHDRDLPVVLTARGFCTLVQGNGNKAAHVPPSWGPYYWTGLGSEALPWFQTLEGAKGRMRALLANAADDVEAAAKPLIGPAPIKDRAHVWWER